MFRGAVARRYATLLRSDAAGVSLGELLPKQSSSVKPGSAAATSHWFSAPWLHDNRPDAFNAATHQRESDCFGETPIYSAPRIATASVTGDTLEVTWAALPDSSATPSPSTPPSAFPISFLRGMAAAAGAPKPLPVPQQSPGQRLAIPGTQSHSPTTLWDRSTFSDATNYAAGSAVGSAVPLPTAQFSDVMGSDKTAAEWLENIEKFGFCLLQGCPPEGDDASVEGIAAKTAHYVRNSVFGGVWGFEDNNEHADTAYNNSSLPLHTDGCYTFDPPGLQMLHCVEYKATGGMSILADGFNVLRQFREEFPQSFDLLCETPMAFTYLDVARGVRLENSTPPIVGDLHGNVSQLRFNDCDRDPLPLDATEELYRAWHELSLVVKRPQQAVHFQLLPGTTLVFDNWRLMHARTSFSGKRRLVGCYMNKEDFLSRLRVVQAAQ